MDQTLTPESLALSASLFHSSVSSWIPRSFGQSSAPSTEDLSLLLRSSGQDEKYDRLGLGHALLSAPRARAGPGPSSLRHLEGRLKKVDRAGHKASAHAGSATEMVEGEFKEEEEEEEEEEESRAKMVGSKRKVGVVDLLGGKKKKKSVVRERGQGRGRAVLEPSSSDPLLLKPLSNGCVASNALTNNTSLRDGTNRGRTVAREDDDDSTELDEDGDIVAVPSQAEDDSKPPISTSAQVLPHSTPRTETPSSDPRLSSLNPPSTKQASPNDSARGSKKPSSAGDGANVSDDGDVLGNRARPGIDVGRGEEPDVHRPTEQGKEEEQAMGDMVLVASEPAEGRSKCVKRREKRKKAREKKLKGQVEG